MELELEGRIALVTGGSEGIGYASALELARSGARVAICARRADPLEAAAAEIRAATGAAVLAVPTDVMVLADLERLITSVVETLGQPTILINNAGTAAANPFDAVDDEQWQADIDLKVMGAIRASRLVVPFMRAAGGGSIVNVLSIAGKHPGASSMPTTVSRAAGIALTKAMSKDLALDNIRVNAVCIGTIKSGQMGRAAQRRFPDMPVEEAFARMGGAIPLGRVGEASEAANLITFLASGAASYITGTAINVDGGLSSAV